MKDIIGIISAGSVIIPVIFLFLFKKKDPVLIRPLSIYIYLCLVVEILNAVSIYLIGNTIALGNIFNLLELLIIGNIITTWIENIELKKYLIIILFIVSAFAFFYQLFYGFDHIVSELKILFSIILITISFLYIATISDLFIAKNIGKTIFTIAVLFYFLSNSIIFSFSDYILLKSHKQFWIFYAFIHALTNIIYNILIAISLYKWKRN